MSGPGPGQGGGGYYQDPNSFYDQQQGAFDPQQQHNMNTVFEEEEPVSSPELGRGDQQWSQNQYDYGAQYQGDGQSRGQGQHEYENGNYSGGGYDYQDQPTQAQSQEQYDPPYYPGYLYDPATNSYISDPNWQPSHGDVLPAEAASEQESNYGQQSYDQQYDYGRHDGEYGTEVAPQGDSHEAEFDSTDPYADDPYQLPEEDGDPYSSYQNSYDQSYAPPQTLPPSHTTHSSAPSSQYDAASSSLAPNPPRESDYDYEEHDQSNAEPSQEEMARDDPHSAEQRSYEPPDSQEATEGPDDTDYQQYDPFGSANGSYGDQRDPFAATVEEYGHQSSESGLADDRDDPYAAQKFSDYPSRSDPSYPAQRTDDQRQPERGAVSRGRADSAMSTASVSAPAAGYGRSRDSGNSRPSDPQTRLAVSPPPPQPPSNQAAYAASPQQQYSSFASVYDAAAQSDSKEPPYDPYAPVPKQSRERAYSGASNLSNRSRPSPAQAQAQVQAQHLQAAAPGRPTQPPSAPYDPYSPSPAPAQGLQARPSTHPPVSPQMQSRKPVTAPPPAAIPQGTASPSLSNSSRTATFSPPPRSSSAQGSAASASRERVAPPAAKLTAPQSAASAFDIPPPRSTTLPTRQAKTAQPPRLNASQPPSRNSTTALSPSTEPAERARPRSPHVASGQSHESQQSTSSSTSNSSGYIPPPPQSSAPRESPAMQKKPAPFGGVMQPPARRAPHQRGASAFGSDSPYGALPSGPLTSAYEPAGSAVEEIKEEPEEEDETPRTDSQPIEPDPQEQRQEEFVPSWMQRSATDTRQSGPYNTGSAAAGMPQASAARSGYAPPLSSKPVDSLADSLGQVSLRDRQGESTRRQAPPPFRDSQHVQKPRQPPPSRSTQYPQQEFRPQHNELSSATRNVAPAPSRPNVPRNPTSGPPPPSRVSAAGPPQNAAPPPRQQAVVPPPMPQQRQAQEPQKRTPARPQQNRHPAVPQLHFEAPAGEREYRPSGPIRPPPPAGQGSRSATPVPMMVVEETAEEEEQYARDGGDYRPSVDGDDEEYHSRQASNEGYEVDEGPGFGDASNTATGATTPSTTYGGEWRADGYDYVSGTHGEGSSQQSPYDPYAPRHDQNLPHDPYSSQRMYQNQEDLSAEEESLTPSIPQQASFGASADSVPQQKFPRQAQQPRKPGPPYAPSAYVPDANESYRPTPASQQQQIYDPYGVPPRSDFSEPGSYGNSQDASSDFADLGLERRTAPLVSFGFGGRMLLVFPETGSRSHASSAFDPSNPYSTNAPDVQPSTPSTVHIRKLVDVLPPPVEATFPGPIFLDGGKANSGKKRKEAMAWLGKRVAELEDEVHHALSGSPLSSDDVQATKRSGKETRLLLVKLVKIFVENDGKLVGTPVVDEAVRAILAPVSTDASDPSSLPTADQLASAASNRTNEGTSTPFVSYGVSTADLDEMSSLLLRGERREAVRYALDHKMWAHAFIIASCIDTDCWKDVTVEFLRAELTPAANESTGASQRREPLRVAYSMFAGLGAESIEQFFPPTSFAAQAQPHLLPAAPIGTLLESRIDAQSQLPESTLESWRDTVGMIVANRTAGDSAALTALGDALAANGWTEAAHVCYLLSPQTSLVGGLGSLSSRITLVGSVPSPASGLDIESIKLTEIMEFGCSLAPTVKGQEAFSGFPHLQAFRLFHAATLADSGNIAQAVKYTEAVVNTLKVATRPSPFYHPRLVAQVKAMGERLGSASGQKDTGSWIARKVPRPTVNSLWSTFEGGFNKFVSGEGEATPQQVAAKVEVAKLADGQPIGPFSHFSAIAPGSNSGTLSRAQSSTDLAGGNHLLPSHPPPRPLSAAAPVPPSLSSPQSNKVVHSPGPPPVKRAPFKTHHARSSSLGAFAGYDFNPTAPPPWQSYTPPAAPRTKVGGEEEQPSTNAAEPEPSARPKPQFAAVEDRFSEDDSGFISPMAQYTPSVSPAPGPNRAAPAQNLSHRRMTTAEELADLGIGNSRSKKPAFDTLDEELEAEEGGAPPPERSEKGQPGSDPSSAPSKADDKPTIKPSKSWLGGWFKREASPAAQIGPGPVKANLGEQKTFYYDEKLKRWINNSGKGGDETPPAIVPPPRASTASPSRAMRGSPRFGSPAPPVPPMPPQRSQTTGPPPLSRSATSSDLRSSSQTSDFKPPSRPASAADGSSTARGPGGARRNKPKYVVVPP